MRSSKTHLPPAPPDVNDNNALAEWLDDTAELPGNFVQIPTAVLQCPSWTPEEKMMWIVLKATCIAHDHSWWSNRRLGLVMGLKKRQASTIVNSLEQKGGLRIEPQTLEEKRKLYPLMPPTPGKKLHGGSKKLHGGRQEVARDPGKKLLRETEEQKHKKEFLRKDLPRGESKRGLSPPAPPPQTITPERIARIDELVTRLGYGKRTTYGQVNTGVILSYATGLKLLVQPDNVSIQGPDGWTVVGDNVLENELDHDGNGLMHITRPRIDPF